MREKHKCSLVMLHARATPSSCSIQELTIKEQASSPRLAETTSQTSPKQRHRNPKQYWLDGSRCLAWRPRRKSPVLFGIPALAVNAYHVSVPSGHLTHGHEHFATAERSDFAHSGKVAKCPGSLCSKCPPHTTRVSLRLCAPFMP
jgi:hypothetical protein